MQITNMEISGICNLKCSYCPYPNMKVERGFMTYKTLEQCLKVLRELKTKKLGLEVFGEPLLHPHIFDFTKKICEVVPEVQFYTNGTLLTREIVIKLKEAGLYGFYVSLHKPEIKKDVLEAVKGLDIFKGFVKTFTHNWAGKVDREIDPFVKNRVCTYIFKQEGTVRWNGDIVNCDMDSTDTNILGNVWDTDVKKIELKHFKLCESCYYKSKDFTLLDKMNRYKVLFILKMVQLTKKAIFRLKV